MIKNNRNLNHSLQIKLFLAVLFLFVINHTYAQNTFPWPSSGSIGIGTTSIHNALTVVGSNGAVYPGNTATFSSNLGSSASTGNQLNITHSDGVWGLLVGCDGSGVSAISYHSPYAAYLINVANVPLYLGSNNAANMTITPGGNVGIGSTSPSVPLLVSKTGNNVTGDMTLLSTFTDPTGIKGVSLGYNEHS